MLVLLMFFLVCVWKALNNHTCSSQCAMLCIAVMCCPRARKMSVGARDSEGFRGIPRDSGNPMPATFRQPHAGNPKQLATLCQAPVAGIQKSSSTAQSKHCEKKQATSTSRYHGGGQATTATTVSRGRCLRDCRRDCRYHGVKRHELPSRPGYHDWRTASHYPRN